MSAEQAAISEGPNVGDRVRLAIFHAGAWRPLCWVRVGTDGSIYLGMLTGKPTVARRLQVPGSPAGRVDIRYDELEDVRGVPPSSRLSFKASGEVHVGDEVLKGVPLESLASPVQLCALSFVHPSRYLPPRTKNANDFDVGIKGYKVDDACPMWGGLIVSPLREENVSVRASLPKMTVSAGVALPFRGLSTTPNLLVQIVIGHGSPGVWPSLPGVVVRARAR